MKKAGRTPGLALLALAAACCAGAMAQERVRPFTSGSMEQIVAGARGQPLVVVVWSLDCSYCEPSFKALAAAQAQRRSGLKVATIATDPADDEEAARLIAKKVSDARLQADIWAFGPAPADRLRHAIDPRWRGEMPRSYWFDAQGRSQAYSGLITAEKISGFLGK